MKILCVIDSLGSGGAQRQLVNLAVGFKEKGHDVSFLVYHSINFFKIILNESDISVHEIIEPNYLKRLLKIRRFIRSGGFDSVLAFLEAAGFICEIAGFPCRKWNLVVGERSANPAMLKSKKAKFFRLFHLFSDYVVANSHENLKMVYKVIPFLPKNKGKVIYNSLDLEIWKPTDDYIPFKDGKFNITIAASFGDVKNLHGLIDAVNLLSENKKEKLQINWYGNENQPGYLNIARKKIEALKLENQFNFFPPSLEIIRNMQTADAIGLFSFYEGLPNAICEGMALGKPVIATNISDIPLIVKNPELLAVPTSPKSIALALEYYIDLTPEQLIEEGKCNRLKAEKIFNKNIIVNEYISLLK